jgi:hypothetical protein
VHVVIILLLIFGVPSSSTLRPGRVAGDEVSQPIAIPRSVPRFKTPPRPTRPTPQPPAPPPPPPMKEVELGPNSKKPDAPAKEAAAKQSDAEPASAATAPDPKPAPSPPSSEPPKPEVEPPAPQRIQVPRPGDYTGVGAIPLLPTTSPWGPPKLDSASGVPASAPAEPSSSSMGRTGLSNRDPQKWENSFDDETAGRCVDIPDLGKNPDGTPVLATVIGRVLDTDGKTPLSGAHLQIMGTSFGTFSDSRGEYRLEFDPRLLAKCRKQYVNVVAPGYRGETLTLMIGPRVRSDDVVLRRH